MKTFRAFVQKEFLHILRDRRTLLVLFGMPVVLIVLLGRAISTEVRDAKVAVLDMARDEQSRSLIRALFATGYFVDAGRLERAANVDAAFENGTAKMVVEIGPDFAKRLEEGRGSIALIADASDPNVARVITSYAAGMVQQWVGRDPARRMPELIHLDHRMHYNPAMKSVYLFVPGVLTVVLMLVSAMLTSISIAREKELGSMEVLLVSPLRPMLIILGKGTPYLLLSLVNAVLVFLVARLLFHVPMNGNYFLLLFEGLLFIMTSLSLGLLFSNVARNQQTALMLSLFMLMMPTILLSGFIFPVSSMPWPLQALGQVIPATHFIIVLRGIMLKGVGLDVLWPQTLLLVAMTVVLLAVSVRTFKLRLQ